KLSARCGDRDRVRARLEVISHDCVLGAAELCNAVDDQELGADALDARAHRREEPAEVLHMRLTRGVEDLRATLGRHRREQDVLGPGPGGKAGQCASGALTGMWGDG